MKRCFLSIILVVVFSASASAQSLNDVQSACDTLVLLTHNALQSAEKGEASSYTRAAQNIRSRTGDDCRSNYFHEVVNRYPDIPYVCTPRRAEADLMSCYIPKGNWPDGSWIHHNVTKEFFGFYTPDVGWEHYESMPESGWSHDQIMSIFEVISSQNPGDILEKLQLAPAPAPTP